MNRPPSFPKVTKYSVFAYRPREFDPRLNYTLPMILVSDYLKQKFITREQFKTLVRKKWVLITRVKGRIWVKELCPEQITDWLS